MNNTYRSKIGDLVISNNAIFIKKYRKKYFIVGDKVVVSEKQIPFGDISSIEVESAGGGIGRMVFNIKDHNLKANDLIGFQNAFEFNIDDLKAYEELKNELDKKIR